MFRTPSLPSSGNSPFGPEHVDNSDKPDKPRYLMTPEEQELFEGKFHALNKLLEYDGSKDEVIESQVYYLKHTLHFLTQNAETEYSLENRKVVDFALQRMPAIESAVIQHILTPPTDPRDKTQWHKTRKSEKSEMEDSE